MEAPEQVKKNSYAEVKSPNVENAISLGQRENGASATISGVVYAALNNYLHMSATLVATAVALIQFPRSLRVFTGMLTDTVPIFGYRRRPYIVIGWGMTFLSCFLMAVLPLGDPYYGDQSIADLDTAELTPEQLATIDTDAPNRGIKMIILMMFANFGTVLAYSGFNGTMIEISQQEPAHLRGTAMGDCDVVFYWFAVVSAFFTGLGLNSEDYGGTFSWSVGFNAIMGVCAATSLIVLPFCWWCIQEERVTSGPSKSVYTFLYELLQRKTIYRYIAFRFFYNVMAMISVTSASAIQSTWAGVEPINNGIATMLAAFLTMLGTQWFWLGVPLLEKIPFAATDFVGALFMLEVDSEDFEATLFGLAVTSQRVGIPFATVITKSIDGYFDIEREYIQQDDHHVRSQVTYAYLIAYAVNLLAIVFVVLLPRQKEELHRMQRDNATNKIMGIATICVLIFALAWSLMTNILSLFDSTSCLRIAGGSGC
ncbi:uncharacterized protein PITG_19677 [Phytophthora infestans T30-4]|uniref:Transmembrane protein, putative n=1 Tax=Phytophthora infestans (strain T30-4) TaxID=403677 RepID=D0P1C9_PHYIT|nr:uncharacterized protein PITG_19677 [Phytophthora infestans T30-4]EEY54159.1 transmembrane protein, putative [Phytophthora infestans T30-4]|eukprot:XP_002895892.1 transmembrane protein, putative [Phytophthora infestans T30-4]